MKALLSLTLMALVTTWTASAQEKQPGAPNAKPIPLDEKLSAIKAKHAVLHDRDSTAKGQRLREVGPIWAWTMWVCRGLQTALRAQGGLSPPQSVVWREDGGVVGEVAQRVECAQLAGAVGAARHCRLQSLPFNAEDRRAETLRSSAASALNQSAQVLPPTPQYVTAG